MKLNLLNSYELDRCYSIAPLHYQGKDHILVAAEKVNKCILFDLDGNPEETVWEEPGGTMSMVQVPGTDGWFLATHQFYTGFWQPISSTARMMAIRHISFWSARRMEAGTCRPLQRFRSATDSQSWSGMVLII